MGIDSKKPASLLLLAGSKVLGNAYPLADNTLTSADVPERCTPATTRAIRSLFFRFDLTDCLAFELFPANVIIFYFGQELTYIYLAGYL
jgi:hypothetical protein